MLERQAVCRAFDRAWAKTGKRMAARMAIIAITTSSSIRVKPALGAWRLALGEDRWRSESVGLRLTRMTPTPLSHGIVDRDLLPRTSRDLSIPFTSDSRFSC